MEKYIVAQFLGIIAICFWVISIQRKEQYKILFMQTLANLVYMFQYALLGGISAAVMNFTSAIRSYVFYKKRKQNKDISNLCLIFFVLVIVIFGILTYNNYLSLIPIIITLFYTVSSWMKDSKWIRIVFLVAGFVWIYYNFMIGAYIGIIGNMLEILSGITSLFKFSKIKEK